MGAIDSAFGFDLSPLLVRANELAKIAQQVVADRLALRPTKENLTICRRDDRKLISAAFEQGASGDWEIVEGVYITLVGRIPRSPPLTDVNSILDEMTRLQQEILNILETQQKDEIISISAAHSERHIQNSNTEFYYEFEPSSEKEQGARTAGSDRRKREPARNFRLVW